MKNQTPIWNLIVSPLESAISYKILMFQKIPMGHAFCLLFYFLYSINNCFKAL